jgi:cyclopropane fatty-acyl-phospholipid synthase-like methyltransferase
MSQSPSREVKRFWEKIFASSEIDYNTLGKRDFSPIIEKLREEGVKRIMDLGCGFGLASIALAKAGFQVKAVDISSQAIRKLMVQASKKGLAIETVICAAQDVATDEHFDAVIVNSVLDHMSFEDAGLTIQNIRLLLDEAGVAFLSFDGGEGKEGEEGEEGDAGDFTSLTDGTRYYTRGRCRGMLWRFYTNQEIKTLLKGFEVMEFRERDDGRREVWVRKPAG